MTAQATASEDWDFDIDGAAELIIKAKVDDGQTHKLVFRRRLTAQWGPAHNYRCFVVTPITHRSGRSLVEHLSRVIDEGQKELALELIRLFDPEVTSLDVSSGQRRQSVVVQHKRRGVVDLASFGDGMRRAAVLALNMSRAAGGVLLIDELETGIHPAALGHVTQRLCEAAQRADVQIVATTHSLEAIDALLAATDDRADRVAAYHLFPSSRDKRVRRYDHAKLARLRASGLDLR